MSTNKIFQVPAILNSIRFLKDKGLGLSFVTNELTNEEKLVISNFYGEFGYLLFKENEFTDAD